MQHKEISTFHVILLFMTSTGLQNHVIIIPSLLEVAGRDAWISILFSFIIYLIFALLIYFVIRKTKQQNLFMWMKEHSWKPITYGIMSLIVVYLLAISILTLKDLTLWTNIAYLPTTPELVIAITFLILCLLAASTSIRTIAIVNGILLPIVVLLGFFVMTANFPKKDYTLLTPLFEHGYQPAIQGISYVGAGMVEIILILFIQHRVKTRINYFSLVMIGILLTWLTIGPTMGAIATFGPEKAGQLRFPAYEQWALVSIGRFLEHVDFLSIYQWLSGGFIRISLVLFLILDLLQITDSKKKIKWLVVCGLIIVIALFIPLSDIQYVHLLSTFFLPGILIYVLSLTILVFLVSFSRKGRPSHYDE